MTCFMPRTSASWNRPKSEPCIGRWPLAADRDQRDIWEHLQVAVAVGLRQHAVVLQRLAHEARVDMGAAIAADELGHVGPPGYCRKQQRRHLPGSAFADHETLSL